MNFYFFSGLCEAAYQLAAAVHEEKNPKVDTDAPTPFSFNMDEMSDDDDDGKIKINSILEKPSVFTNFFIFRVQLLRFHAKKEIFFPKILLLSVWSEFKFLLIDEKRIQGFPA